MFLFRFQFFGYDMWDFRLSGWGLKRHPLHWTPVHKFLSCILKIDISNEGKTWRGGRWGRGEKRHIPPHSIAESYCLRSIKLSCDGGRQSTLWAGDLRLVRVSGGNWPVKLGCQNSVQRLWPFSYPALSLLSYTLGSHCLTDTFWKKIKFLRAFLASTSPRGTSANWVFQVSLHRAFFKDQNSWVESMTQWKARPTGLTA